MKFKDIFLIPNLVTIARLLITIYLFLNLTPDQFSITNLIVIIAIIGLVMQWWNSGKKIKSSSKLGIIRSFYWSYCVCYAFILVNWLLSIMVYLLTNNKRIIYINRALYVLIKNKTVTVSNKGKLGTTLIFISICLTILNTSLNLMIIDYFTYISLIFYYYVALEYLYKLIYKNE